MSARSTLAKSIDHAPWMSRSYGRVDHEIETRQVIEQRIARPRHEHLVAGVGQQLEQQRVRLARARGQHDALGRRRRRPGARSRRRRPARASSDAERLRRRSAAPRAIGERREQIGRIVEARARRIRLGEIDERLVPSRARAQRLGQPIARQIRRKAARDRRDADVRTQTTCRTTDQRRSRSAR